MEVFRRIEQRRAAHDDRARMIGAVAVAHIGRRAVMDAADALHRDFQRVGGDLGEHGLHPLADRGRADEHRDRAAGLDLKPRGLLRAGGAALDEATHSQAVIAPVDQPALQLRLVGPAKLGKAAVEHHGIIAAVELVLRLERRNRRHPIGHLGGRNEIAAAELDPVEAKILRYHVEQALAEEIGLEAPRPAVGADGRFVGHPQRRGELDVGDAVRPRHELGDVARADGAVGAHIGAHIDIGVAAESQNHAIARAGDFNVGLGLAGVVHG